MGAAMRIGTNGPDRLLEARKANWVRLMEIWQGPNQMK